MFKLWRQNIQKSYRPTTNTARLSFLSKVLAYSQVIHTPKILTARRIGGHTSSYTSLWWYLTDQ